MCIIANILLLNYIIFTLIKTKKGNIQSLLVDLSKHVKFVVSKYHPNNHEFMEIGSYRKYLLFPLATCALINYRGSEFIKNGKTIRVHIGFLGKMRTINTYAKLCKVGVRIPIGKIIM